jgi:hypothetical protein
MTRREKKRAQRRGTSPAASLNGVDLTAAKGQRRCKREPEARSNLASHPRVPSCNTTVSSKLRRPRFQRREAPARTPSHPLLLLRQPRPNAREVRTAEKKERPERDTSSRRTLYRPVEKNPTVSDERVLVYLDKPARLARRAHAMRRREISGGADDCAPTCHGARPSIWENMARSRSRTSFLCAPGKRRTKRRPSPPLRGES